MIILVAAAVLSTQVIDGSLEAGGAAYAVASFDVPEGALEITIARVVADDANIIDFGVFSPDGFRGWGGGLTDDAVIGVAESSRGYLPGPLTAGTWHVVLGKASLAVVPAAYQITVTVRDDVTLAQRPRAEFSDTPLEQGARWYAGDLHVHSNESGDAPATLPEIAVLAREQGLDFVVISDHNTVSGHALAEAAQATLDNPPLLIRGNEVTTYAGHGNAIGAPTPIDHRLGFEGKTMADIISDVRAAGGLFVINHPSLELGGACIGCAWKPEATPWELVSAIEIHTGPISVATLFGPAAREMWDEALDQGHRVTAVGGSDDHRAGVDLSSTQSPIGSPTTLVYAEELSESAIREGIEKGRVVVLQAGPSAPRVELEVTSDSSQVGQIGDTIGGERITVNAKVTGGAESVATLVVSGRASDTRQVSSNDETVSWEVSVPPDGARYRVHVQVGADLATVTNHVFVDFAEGPASGGCGCKAAADRSGLAPLALLFLALLVGTRWSRRRSSRSRSRR